MAIARPTVCTLCCQYCLVSELVVTLANVRMSAICNARSNAHGIDQSTIGSLNIPVSTSRKVKLPLFQHCCTVRVMLCLCHHWVTHGRGHTPCGVALKRQRCHTVSTQSGN